MYTSIPMDYEQINLYQGTRAPTGEVMQSQAGAYYWRCLYHRLISTIQFKLPDTWNETYLKHVLFGLGFVGVVDTPEYGVVPQFCTLTGYGIYRQPVEIRVASPLINFHGAIGDTCELIKMTPDYLGVCDIIDHYAGELANLFGALNMAIENSKLATLFFPRNQAAAQAIKGITERISSGEARIFADKLLKEDLTDSSGDSIFVYTTRAKENYIVTDILDDITNVITEFDREIGIPVIPEKRERYNELEILHTISGSAARLSLWSDCLQQSIDKVNKHWPELNISFETVADQVPAGGDPAEDPQQRGGADNV